MDTNSITLLVNALAQQKSAVPSSNLVLILVALTPLIAAIAAWFAKKTAVSIEKIHVAVNSERSVALEEIRTLKAEVRSLSEKLAFGAGEQQADAAQATIEAAILAAAKKVQDTANQPN